MKCPRCQAENDAGASFCEDCGARLEAACPSCGTPVTSGKKFCRSCGTALTTEPADRFASPESYTPKHLAEKILTSKAALEGERKQVTVLFVDASGFTSLSERLDPEDVHGMMTRVFELILAEVHRYEGTVNQFLGDGVMALFGAPIAHEDHARRGVQAALGISKALGAYADELRLRRGITFRVRQGLNTGLVVVGSIGSDLRMDYTAVGDTTNVAARMQQAAEPGHVLISEATHRLVSGYFDLLSLGELSLKGKAEPVRAWDVVSARASRTRLEVEADRGFAPLVGRERELRLLEEAFERATAGHGQVVFIVGEPGIGKSRLLYEFRRRVADRATWLEGHCLSFGQAIAFHPLIDLLKRSVQIEEGDSESAMAEKIDAGVLRLGSDLRPIVPYLRSLLSVDPGDPAVSSMDPRLRRGEIFAALGRLINRAAQLRPQIVVFEDLHWIDKATEEFLVAMTDGVPTLRVLFVFTYRPGYRHPFGERTYQVRIAPAPLSAEDSMRIAEGVLAAPGLPEEIVDILVRKGEGNPFYVEEVIRSLKESGAVRLSGSGYVLARRLDEIVVPDTIQDVIMARIDRLDEAPKKTLQLASVIGREFTRRLLDRLAETDKPTDDLLRELKAIELIYEKQLFPEPAYLFKHALTQDVAYNSLLRERRKDLHGLIGHAVEDLYAERLAEHCEMLAHHFSKAEVWDKALHYLLEAAAKAVNAFAVREALALYAEALAVADRLGEQVPASRVMAIHRTCSELFYTVGDFAEARREADHLLDLARRTGDQRSEAGALVLSAQATVWMEDFPGGLARAAEAIAAGEATGLKPAVAGGLVMTGMVHGITARHDQAQDELDRALTISRAAGILSLQGLALHVMGNMRNWHGRHLEALELATEGVQVAREHPQFVSVLTRCLWTQGVAWTSLGDYDAALRVLEEGRVLCEKLGNELELNRLLNTLGWLHIECHDLDRGLAFSAQGLELARRSRHATGFERVAFNLADQADAFLNKGDLALASEVLDEAINIVEHPPASRWMTWRYATHCLASLGELWLARGDLAQAERFADQSLEIAVPTRSRKYEVRAWRVKGESALARRRFDEAREALDKALAIARQIGNPGQLWKTHAAVARFHEAAGRREQALAASRAAREVLDGVRTRLQNVELRAALDRAAFLRDLPTD